MHDTVDGHEQGWWERTTDGVTGAVTLVSTAYGGAKAGMRSSGVAPNSAAGAAHNAANGAKLNKHLSQLQDYGSAGFKELQNGRIRYFGEVKPPRNAGTMAGTRRVREWDPATGLERTWMETIDHSGRVRIVRPETGGPKVHFQFDENGNFIGTFRCK